MPHAITILADGFEEIEAVTCVNLLRRAGINVTILGLDSLEVRGARDIKVRADKLLKDLNEPFDAIILPGGMPGTNNLAASQNVLNTIRSANNQGKLCAAICAAPTVLAKAGILENKKATCYPGRENEITGTGAGTGTGTGAQLSDDKVVTDQNVITSRAAGTTIPFALEIIKTLVGGEAAEKVKRAILYL